MTFKDSIDFHNRVAELDSFRLSDEDKEALHRSLSDPTSLKPFLEQQIEQNDMHTQQIEQLQAALQKQILDAAEERHLREIADKDEHQFTLKWNWCNLIVAIAGVLFGLAGFVVGLLALLATH